MGEQLVAAAELLVRRFVLLRATGHDRVHRRPRLGQAERDALAGQRVDVAGGVADEQHPAERACGRALAQRPGALGPRERPAAQPLLEQRVLGEQLVERRLPLGQHRDPDQLVGDRRHVGLRPRGPVHLDERRPRRHLDVHPQPEPAPALGRPVEAEHPAHRRVQAVGGDEVAGGLVVDEDVAAAVLDLADRALARS